MRVAQAADREPVSDRDGLGFLRQDYLLAGDKEAAAGGEDGLHGAGDGVADREAAGGERGLVGGGLRGDDLADAQVLRRVGLAIDLDRVGGGVGDFQAVDADAGEAGDGAADASAADACAADACAADAAFGDLQRGRAGSADAAIGNVWRGISRHGAGADGG